MLRVSLTLRERVHCEDSDHAISDNSNEVIDGSGNEEEANVVNLEKLKEIVLKLGALRVVDLGGVVISEGVAKAVVSPNLVCLRVHDCIVDDETLKIFGNAPLRDVEIVGFSSHYSVNGLKHVLVPTIEAVHADCIIDACGENVPLLKRLWTRVTRDENFEAFAKKFGSKLEILDVTFARGAKMDPIVAFERLKKLSITSTDADVSEVLSRVKTENVTVLNVCVWNGNGNALIAAIARFTRLESLTINGRSPRPVSEFRIDDVTPLRACQNLKQLRLVLSNHAPQLLESIVVACPLLEVFEFVSRDVTSLLPLGKLTKLSVLDVCAPHVDENTLVDMLQQCKQLLYIRPNFDHVTNKLMHAVVNVARARPDAIMELVLNARAEVDVDACSKPSNLTVRVKESQFLLNFPASTPRAF